MNRSGLSKERCEEAALLAGRVGSGRKGEGRLGSPVSVGVPGQPLPHVSVGELVSQGGCPVGTYLLTAAFPISLSWDEAGS